MGVRVDVIRDDYAPELARILAALDDTSGLYGRATETMEQDVRARIREQVPLKHRTANRLNAQPTRHLGKAADGVRSSYASNGGEVTIDSPGFSRVFRSLTIKPSPGKKFLTIPADPRAYGKRVSELRANLSTPIFRPGKMKALATRKKGDKGFQILYWLVKRVNIPQDRELLPSDDALAASAARGLMGALRDIRENTK